MSTNPIDDIEAWSRGLSPWKQDCLRRLAIGTDFSDVDFDAALAMIKAAAGFKLPSTPPTPVPFSKAHFGTSAPATLTLKGIANIQNVNQLAQSAALRFCPDALTIVYGRNGSGKSGFVRILRTACRTRVENPAKLKVLADVYGSSSGPQAADIIVDTGAGDTAIKWMPDQPAIPELMQVAVFDSASAQLYVDSGNQIRFLPFGLALPHRLNTVCLQLKDKLEDERTKAVGNKVSLTAINFGAIRSTAAQNFDRSLKHTTTNDQISKATSFDAGNLARLTEIAKILTADSVATADITAFALWLKALIDECRSSEQTFNDRNLEALAALRADAVAKREAASLAAKSLFTDEPLPGVGTESWRVLWKAARDFSVREAYVDLPFPVTSVDGSEAGCVLCQQPLQPVAADRMARFQKYMDDALDVAATRAEEAVSEALSGLPEPKLLGAADFKGRLEQIRKRDSSLAEALQAFQAAILTRWATAIAYLNGLEGGEVPACSGVVGLLDAFALRIEKEKQALAKADSEPERAKLLKEKEELEDQRTLAANKERLTTRRDLLITEKAYSMALAEVQTKGITQRANELLDTHLTHAVVTQFDAEREQFEITHLKVSLARRSGKTKAEFEISPQTKLTKVTSEILSEGEQRALALAGFLTEVELTEGEGPIVIDDPVSSLDRDRSIKVAERIAEESQRRQVIVFTHDIVFFNELNKAADALGIEPVTIALFRDKVEAGKVDPAGMVWKGLNVAKRLGKIKQDFAPMAKLHSSSPSEYEYRVKGLYGRLRDTYERVVEEVIFRDIVRRGTDVIQTQLLRYVRLSDPLAIRFHDGMTRANTHSHDNPAADTVQVPSPDEFNADIANIEKLIADLRAEGDAAEAARPQMKPKK